MARKLNPSKNNPEADKVYTPYPLAKQIVDYFKPCGTILEPSAGPVGQQAFCSAITGLEGYKMVTWFELDEGLDFLNSEIDKKFNWSISNWPYSKFRAFLKKNMEVAKNIVTLCPINHVLGLKARLRDIDEAGFFIREILRVQKPDEWPSSGFEYAAIYLNKEPGDCKISKL